MKTKHALLSTVLTIALTLPMFGQPTLGDTTKADIKINMMKHDISSMMGKPTFDAKSEGLHMVVWLMTQEEHKKMMMRDEKESATGKMEMSGMKDTSMKMDKDIKVLKDKEMAMDKPTGEAIVAGTHHIMLDVTDTASGKEVANASAKVLVVSPSKKNSTVALRSMKSHFGSDLTLDEKGEYQLTVSVNAGGASKSTRFNYTVK